MEFERLKAYQRAHRDSFSEGLGLRVHRALSWLQRAEQAGTDDDAQYIFYWIAFNAAYANDMGKATQISESRVFSLFLKKICQLDSDNKIGNLIWQEYSGSFRILIDNHYVFQPFWDHHNLPSSNGDWQDKFASHRAAAHRSLSAQNTAVFLSILFANLYTLRNQLLHGGATWNSGINREQVKLGRQVLSRLVPHVIEIMMCHPAELWGDAFYPVVNA